MFVKSLPVLALAIAAVNGSPVNQIRQVSSVASGVSSAVASGVSSAVSGASSAVVPSSVASGASSVASGASSAASSAVSGASSAASSAVSGASSGVATATAAVPTNGTAGNQSFPAYPCPAGYLLTYVEQNVTIPAPYPAVRSALGDFWVNSTIFGPLVVNSTGTGVGSSHLLNLQGVIVEETLVNATSTDASRILTWNLTNGPIEAMGVGVSNYSTVLSVYDPDYETNNNTIGNSTVALTFTNFCATSQAEGMTLVMSLGALELGQLQQALASGAPASSSAPASSAAATSSMAANMTSSMVMSMTAVPSSVASSVAESGSSAVVSASSALSSLVNMTTTSA